MDCYKLILAYDGTKYKGWQVQPNAVTIQECLEKAVGILHKGERIAVIGSGRTDAGVHAKGQVAHFFSPKKFDLHRLLFSLNGLLPLDIRVKSVEIVDLDFHSRYSAISKEYHYHLHLQKVEDPFLHGYSWHFPWKIDIDLLKKAAHLFIGTHDFTSFANEKHAGSAAKNPVRTLYRLDVIEIENGVRLEFEGDGFLYKMVRNIVGTLMDVAIGKLILNDIKRIFEAKDRRKASQAAPPQGLFLMYVDYDGKMVFN